MRPREHQGPTQRTLAGLLGLLDLRGAETSPNSIAGFVQPSLDVMMNLQGATQRFAGGTGNLAIIGTSATFQGTAVPLIVPLEETWFVWRASASLTLQPADSIVQWGLALRFSGAAGIGVMNLASTGPIPAATGVGRAFVQMDRPLIATGGMEFGISFGDVVMAAAQPFDVALLVSKVRST